MPAEPQDFRAHQRQLTDWLRAPATQPAPDVEPRRLAIYRELFFNNVCSFVEAAYPVLKSLLPAAEWEDLLQRFFAGHRCQSPYFRDISLEFRHWMEAANADWLAAHPWALELMHFEWVELAADCAEAAPEAAAVQPDGDLLAGVPALSPFVWPLVYRWPVHRFAAGEPPAEAPPAQPTCLLALRDADDEVRFLPVNPLVARLIELLQQHAPRPGRELLLALAAEAGQADSEAFVAAGAALLEDLRAQGIVLGTRLAAA